MNGSSIRPTGLLALALPLALLAACGQTGEGDDDTDGVADECVGPYEPFNADNYANQFVRVDAFGEIEAIRRAEDFSAASFDEIEDLYLNSADLAAKVASRQDDHPYAQVVEIGAVLDQRIRDAIAAGQADEDIDVQAQVVSKTLQRFFFLSVYHYVAQTQEAGIGSADAQKGWDEAFGYYGASNDGASAEGIAGTMTARDDEFGLDLFQPVYDGLVQGKCLIAAGDLAGIGPIVETIDISLLRGFAASVVHEMDEYAEDPLVKGAEGWLYWDMVADFVKATDAAAWQVVEDEFALGFDAIDPQAVREAVTGAFGFSF